LSFQANGFVWNRWILADTLKICFKQILWIVTDQIGRICPMGRLRLYEAYETWLSEAALTPDPNFFTIIKRAEQQGGGAGKLSAHKPSRWIN